MSWSWHNTNNGTYATWKLCRGNGDVSLVLPSSKLHLKWAIQNKIDRVLHIWYWFFIVKFDLETPQNKSCKDLHLKQRKTYIHSTQVPANINSRKKVGQHSSSAFCMEDQRRTRVVQLQINTTERIILFFTVSTTKNNRALGDTFVLVSCQLPGGMNQT